MIEPSAKGFKAAMGGIDIARVVVAAMCAGMLRSALDCRLPPCPRIGEAFGQAVADFQGVQWQLADVATDIHAIDRSWSPMTRRAPSRLARDVALARRPCQEVRHSRRTIRSIAVYAGHGSRRLQARIPAGAASRMRQGRSVHGRHNRDPERGNIARHAQTLWRPGIATTVGFVCSTYRPKRRRSGTNIAPPPN